jgi:imidazolonepropionase
MASTLLTDCRLATALPGANGVIEIVQVDDGALVINDATVAWAGPRSSLPGQWESLSPQSCGGQLLTPGLVDAFTALDPGPASGTDDDSYVAQALVLLSESLTQGVTWREFKTGAVVDPEGALRQLLLARRIQSSVQQRLSVTLRTAHVGEDDESRTAHLETLCTRLIPDAHAMKLLDAVEAVCDEEVDPETGEAFGFSLDDASTVLEAAYRKKIPTRLVCERHSDTGAVALAPSFYARCAAYLNFCDVLGVEALAQARTTAMLLPLAQEPDQRLPPVSELRDQRIQIALGTAAAERHGRSSRAGRTQIRTSLLLAARRGRELYGLTAAEAFAGITSAGARVLGGPNADSQAGTLSVGASADLALWEANDLEALLESEPPLLPQQVWVHGRAIHSTR